MTLHNSISTPAPLLASGFRTWQQTLTREWKLITLGALASLLLASVLMSGLTGGLFPDLSRPYAYSGDGLFHGWMAQRVAEGWLFDNARSGYPFGSNFLDFPGSDTGDHVFIKIFALLGGGWPAGVKLFYLFGFPTCFVATYVTARAFGLTRSFAFVTGALYTFAPFHFLRLPHLFYTWYFVAPLFFYLALDIYLTRAPVRPVGIKSHLRKLPALAVGMLVLSSFGVYYALFGAIILSTAGVMSVVKSHNLFGAKKTALLLCAIIASVLINTAPNILGTYQNGPNPEVAQRSPVEAETYGLKMMQLLLPRQDHRVRAFGSVAQRYNEATPLINENATSSAGLIGAAGFLLALIYFMFAPARTESDDRLRLLAVTTFVLFLFATIGGLGSLFAWVVSPSIRGWNRDSIFVTCGALFFFFVLLQVMLQKYAPRLAKYSVAIAAVLLVVGLFDQTASPCKSCIAAQNAVFDGDKEFVQSIERALPEGGSVYQLPYIGFPEVPLVNRLINYQMMIGVLHSKSLHWSFGGMKGRPGDLFYRALAEEPMTRQLEVIRKLGFDGIYIDRRGYADNGEALVKQLSQLLQQAPLLQSADKEIVFFKLDDASHPKLAGLSPYQIERQAGFVADTLGPRYSGDLASGIDFTRNGAPEFLSGASGLYPLEPWGRWTGRKAEFDFADPLPQKFTLIIKAQAYATNAQAPTRVEIGNKEYDLQFTAGISEVRLDVDLQGSSADSITFVPPKPVSPRRYAGIPDGRVLGLGFISLRIVQ